MARIATFPRPLLVHVCLLLHTTRMSHTEKRSKAGKASGISRAAKAKQRNDGVIAAYSFLRTGKPAKGHQFLIDEGSSHIETSIAVYCDVATAVSIISDRTGYTKRRVRQILSKYQ